MAASNVSALVDLVSEPTAAPTAEPVEPEVPVETESEPVDSPESEDTSSPEGESASEPAPGDSPVDARTNPAAIRSALKTLRDSDPKNAPIARELNDAYGRYTAYRSVFPKVADAQAAKAALDAVGGADGLTEMHATLKSVNETDELLYKGDGRVLETLIEDMKAAGHPEAFGKLADPFLEQLKKHDSKAYYDALRPHFFQGLVDVGFDRVLGSLKQLLSVETPNVDAVRQQLATLGQWFDEFRDSVDRKSKDALLPERQAFEKERSDFQTQKQKDFQNSVGTAADTASNRALGSSLKRYLQMPFFKGFSRESLTDLASGIKSALLSELTADKSYQSQMDAFFSQKSPDRDRILSYHDQRVQAAAARIVKSVIERRYPNYLKAGAKPTTKPGTKPTTPMAAGAPVFVMSKPDGNDIDWDKDPSRHLFITGKAYLKSGKFVTWNPKNKR